jgi:pyridoxal phosphate enzyme (YggS family)
MSSTNEDTLAQRLAAVQGRVAAAMARAGRPAAAARIVAVTKKHPAEVVAAARDAGVRDVGENYAQEMVAKLEALGAPAVDAACAWPPAGEDALRWHFIGQLQRNKVKYVVGRAVLIHAVDSAALAREIAHQAEVRGVVQPVLIAVSLGGEEQKSGVTPEELPELLAVVDGLAHVSCAGLMTMPPLARAPEDSRPYFRRLVALRDALATAARPLGELSMGTTDDFEIALEEGATLVRIGTAIFGARPVPAAAGTDP